MLDSIVLSNGILDDRKIYRREKLYQGMNGRFVERFYLSETESYIFKPLTNSVQIGKEVWIYKHILVEIPPIYPKIIAHSISPKTDNNWMILEDLGTINHSFDEEIAINIIKWMASWHSFPVNHISSASLQGPKPFIEEMVEIILLQKRTAIELLRAYSISETMIKHIYTELENKTFITANVLSHGDLHQGNYGYADNRIVVLDWEHVHINSPYWDLYHFLDISHPVFPKMISRRLRNCLLDCYLYESKENRSEAEKEAFKQEYYLFSAAFSIWMLLLIQGDLNKNETKWPKKQLLQQQAETLANLGQCGEELLQTASKKELVYL